MSDCQSIDCCPSPIFSYGLTGVLTPGPPIIVVDPPVYRLLFFDDFNGENGGAPSADWDSFINWDVQYAYLLEGQRINIYFVDLRDYTTAGYPGGLADQRLFVELIGSQQNYFGGITTKQEFTFAPGTYRFSFRLAGSQIGEIMPVTASIGTILSQDYTVPILQGFTIETIDFVVTSQVSGKISFQSHKVGSNPSTANQGPLIDDVKLEQIA